MIKRQTQGAVDVVVLDGVLNGDSSSDLTRSVEPVLAHGFPMLVLDLAAVPLIDSRGLETLLDLQDAARARGGTIKLAGPTPLCSDILRATGVGDQFEIFSDAKLGVGSYAR